MSGGNKTVNDVKTGNLTDFFRAITDEPPFPDCSRLSFHIAREFAKHPTADPEDYSGEFGSLCDKLSLDSEEMQTLVAGKIESVKYPLGQVFAGIVTKALKDPKRFRMAFKSKRFVLVNIFYHLSESHKHDLFNIPAKMVAERAHTTQEVVYAFITELKKKGFIKEIVKEDRANHKGRLFKWLEPPAE